MKPFDPSSGDALADRRADFADMLLQSGDAAAAAELMLQALEKAPGWAYGWFRLGEMHEAAGAVAPAAEAFRMALKLDPEDHAGAVLKLHLTGAAEDPEAMPAAFVETLFDQYAGKFETSLVVKLGYRAPELLFDAIKATHPGRFACAIDLGCGTGLMGERLHPVCDRLEGYDLSTGMLKVARAKGIYDVLEQADLAVLSFDTPRADLAVAADVYMYVGALETAFANARTMVVPGGLFAFSVEKLDEADGFALCETRRYAHSQAYVESCLSDAGFRLLSLSEATIRKDREQAVTGMIVVATRPD
ncbi:class I SAM-dependent methyltransferase [Mesorhizobium sp. J428]|uniref:class I SAM-dependent DNA methyltransferase n=1 Tax=Mesorhizobium sp. J428 TaxID=2898440 RepID=UPI0021519613|nr:methyltransferase domain-containing protein [Mesorhizobium sp. J428]MCR5858321.1 methyltransferase domain-containing protein [Mesorhizobium sp. J428]